MSKQITKTLESDRLLLRKFKIEDAQQMYDNWESDPECCKYLSWNVANIYRGMLQKMLKKRNQY